MSLPILPGAEPWSHEGGPVGALCIHGFTGTPASMRPLAGAFADAGFSVELPLLPGHGTTVEDMITTGWGDWAAAVAGALASLTTRTERQVVVGQSLGGALALWLAAREPSLAGIVTVNPVTQPQPPEVAEMIREWLGDGMDRVPAVGSDIAKEGAVELCYDATPLAPMLTLLTAMEGLSVGYGACRQPLLLFNSPQDHVVAPEQGDHLAATWGGTVERVILERSYHVATQDHDADLIVERSVAFGRRVCGAPVR